MVQSEASKTMGPVYKSKSDSNIGVGQAGKEKNGWKRPLKNRCRIHNTSFMNGSSKLECYITTGKACQDKYSSLLGPFMSYEQKEL